MDEKSLEYSFDASLNRTLFYSEFNDINIYVEDINKEYEYETVFKRLLGDEYRISSIFCMGGKIGVIKAFEENKKQNINDLNFYIVDGDFDRYIFPEKMIKDSARGNITDDAMVVEKYTSVRVKLTQSSYKNIKITTPDDIIIAESFIKK